MKKIIAIFILIAAGNFLFATQPLDNQLPESFRVLRDAVYESDKSEQTIDSLYSTAVEFANQNYEGAELLNLISMCDYVKGLDSFYREDKKNAIKFLKGINVFQLVTKFNNYTNLRCNMSMIVKKKAVFNG